MTTDTSAEAVRCALLRMSMAGEKAGCEIVWEAYSALAAERDALSQQLAEARKALSTIEDMGNDLRGAKMATLKIGLAFLCTTAAEALATTGEET